MFIHIYVTVEWLRGGIQSLLSGVFEEAPIANSSQNVIEFFYLIQREREREREREFKTYFKVNRSHMSHHIVLSLDWEFGGLVVLPFCRVYKPTCLQC